MSTLINDLRDDWQRHERETLPTRLRHDVRQTFNHTKGLADVTVTVDAAPVEVRSTLRRDVVEFEGDGKVLRRHTLNTDLNVRDVWKHIRRRARSVEGCTAIRFNGALYSI